MKHFRISFNGRTKGAIGIFYGIDIDVMRESMDLDAAREIAYEKHEHVMFLRFAEIVEQ